VARRADGTSAQQRRHGRSRERAATGATGGAHGRRTGAAALAVAGAALVLSGLAPAAGAQEPVPESTTTTSTTTTLPYDPNNFPNGEARASADTFELNVKQGNANIGMTYGRSLSNYMDITGSSEARALDLGVLPVLFGVEQCDGSAPVLNPATFPVVTRADSSEAGADASRRAEAFMPGTGTSDHGPSAGFQDATARPGPWAHATTESADADVFLVALRGGRTEVTTSLEDHVRTAHAVTTATELSVFGGLFTFENPKWEAIARSGRVSVAEGRFTFSSAKVLGIPRTPEDAMADLAGFKAGLEQLLAPLGVQFELPTVEVTGNRVIVRPMAFRIVDPPWGAQVIAPFLADLKPLRDSLIQQALDEDCKNETTVLLLDVILGVVSGSGSVEIEAGGVDVSTADTDFPSPQPMAPPAPPTTSAPLAAATTGTAEYDEYTAGTYTPGTAGTRGFTPSGELTDLGVDDTFEVPVEVADATDTREESLAVLPSAAGSRFEDSGAGSAAVAVGLIGLLGALGLTFGERFLSRRSSRRIP
jgi:hypothetical protein